MYCRSDSSISQTTKETGEMRLVKEMFVDGKRGRVRPQKKWLEVIENAINNVDLSYEDPRDRVERKLRRANPKQLGEKAKEYKRLFY